MTSPLNVDSLGKGAKYCGGYQDRKKSKKRVMQQAMLEALRAAVPFLSSDAFYTQSLPCDRFFLT